MTRISSDELLAKLIVSAEGRPFDLAGLRALVEEASHAGAIRALAVLGLEDGHARRDVDELRELLGTWRDVKRSAWQAVARWIVRVLLALVMLGLAYRLRLTDLLKN